MLKITEERIRVLYPSGALYRHVTRKEAHQMIRAGVAQGLGSKTKLRTIQLLEGPCRPVAGTYYSHHSETQDNPPNVYALRPISHLDRALFTTVQAECLIGQQRSAAGIQA